MAPTKIDKIKTTKIGSKITRTSPVTSLLAFVVVVIVTVVVDVPNELKS
jgi:hypothetical protein